MSRFRLPPLLLVVTLLFVEIFSAVSSFHILERGLRRMSEVARRSSSSNGAMSDEFIPPVLPLSVTAQRLHNNTATVTFVVQHTGPGAVTLPINVIRPSGQGRQVLGTSSDGTSLVHFTISLDWCPTVETRRDMYASPFTFTGLGDGAITYVTLNLCFFDVNREYIETYMRDDSIEGLQPFSFTSMAENIVFPRVFVDQADRVKIFDEGENTTIGFSLEVSPSSGRYYYATMLFYDLVTDAMVGSEYFIERTGGSINVEHIARFGQFDGVDQLRQTGTTGIRAGFELSLATASGRYSGVVHILAYLYNSIGPSRLPTTRSAAEGLPIFVKRRGQDEALPENKFLFREVTEIRCDDTGNDLMNTGPDCSIQCFVNGRGVSSLEIRPSQPNTELESSQFEVFESHAEAFLNLGPARASINGSYVCSATGNDGVVATHNIDVIVRL